MVDQWVRKSGRVAERMSSSEGNPRFRVTFDDGTTFTTVAGGQVGYLITNSDFDGLVEILTNARGEITHIRACG